MYLEYFGLTEKPFQITPDPRFLYMSRRHRDGFAHLLYGADEAGGFVLLTGEVGTGKTTLCRSALASTTDKVRVALILNPKQSPLELVASICDELQVVYPKDSKSLKALIDRLNLYLLKAYGQGQRIVVVIDEAQNLAIEVLEQVRLLTNLEVSTQKLLQIILIGQPELQSMLARPELRQLAQRITARFHLTPLTREETGEYIAHRLKIAGVTREIFTQAAVNKIFKISHGIPRIVNTLCERSLIGAYGANAPLIKTDIVANAADEVLGTKRKQSKQFYGLKPGVIAGALIAIALVIILGITLTVNNEPSSTIANASTSPPVVVAPQAPVIVDSKPIKQTTLPPEQTTTFDTVVKSSIDQATTSLAFDKLFDLWGRDYSAYSGSTACTKATNAGMRCIFGEGDMDVLLQYNRPAVVELSSAEGKLFYAVLNMLKEQHAVLNMLNDEFEIELTKLENLWTGNYVVLWKPPFPTNESLAKGFIGPDVLWLRHQLDNIEGREKAQYSAENLQFDEELADRVSAFQVKQGLEPDGIVGRETFIALANQTDAALVPRLKVNKG